MSQPDSMKAVVASEGHTATIQDRPLPQLTKEGEVLVKVEAVAINPTDWKHVKMISQPGAQIGCDFAGVVVGTKGDTASISMGDRVAGFVHGGKYEDRGSFAQYLKTEASLTVKIPANVDTQRATSVGIGGYTASQALFQRLGLNLPSVTSTELPTVGSDAPQLLIWSGSTSVGQWAIQLGRAAGYHVIATASPSNHALLQKMGAAEVYDYREEGLPEKISKEHPNLHSALDCISENGTQSLCVRSLGANARGKVVVLLKPESEAKSLRSDVSIIHTLAYTCLGKPFTYGAANFSEEQVMADRQFIEQFASGSEGLLHHLLETNQISGNRIKAASSGLEGTLEGLKLLESGKVSGEKLVYNL